jgi:hypothetical protein
VVSAKRRDDALLHRLFQAQVLHSVLDLHVLSKIVDRFRDKLRQPKPALTVSRLGQEVHIPLILVIASKIQSG